MCFLSVFLITLLALESGGVAVRMPLFFNSSASLKEKSVTPHLPEYLESTGKIIVYSDIIFFQRITKSICINAGD
jgi:hypothetical protein